MAPPPPNLVTQLLDRINDGDTSAPHELLPLVYDELHGLARQVFARRGEHTLQATALVHEAYIRLLGADGQRAEWNGRRHFFSVAAMAMRRVLTDYARLAAADKRGGGARRVSLSEAPQPGGEGLGSGLNLLDLNDALTELEKEVPRVAKVVALRFFSGMEMKEIALELGVAERSVYKDWRAGRALLRQRLRVEGDA